MNKLLECAVSLAKSFEFSSHVSDIVLNSKRTYKLRVLYGPSTTVMYTVTCVPDTRVRANQIRFYMIPNKWQAKLPTLRTAIMHPLSVDGLIVLHLLLGELNIRFCFRITQYLKVNVLLSTSFIDGFIPSNFSTKQKVRPWHSRTLSLLIKNADRMDNPTAEKSEEEQQRTHGRQSKNEKTDSRVALQIILKPFTRYPVLVTTSLNGLLTIEPKHLSADYSLVTAANC